MTDDEIRAENDFAEKVFIAVLPVFLRKPSLCGAIRAGSATESAVQAARIAAKSALYYRQNYEWSKYD